MNVKPIRTEQDYKEALALVSSLMDQQPDAETEAGELLDVLLVLVDAYEREHHSIAPPDPIEAIKFRMEQGGLTARDLAPFFGQTNRVYEVLAGKRGLTGEMIRNLHEKLGIPLESLYSGHSKKAASSIEQARPSSRRPSVSKVRLSRMTPVVKTVLKKRSTTEHHRELEADMPHAPSF